MSPKGKREPRPATWMIERRVGLAGPEPAPALGRMKAARGDAPRGDAQTNTIVQSAGCVGRVGLWLASAVSRRVVDERRGKFRRRVTLHVARRFQSPSRLRGSRVAPTPLRHTRRARRRRERIASGRASIGVDLALARWVTTTARRGSFPPSRRRGRGPETRQIRPRRRPLRAARTAPCSPVGPAAAGAPCPPQRAPPPSAATAPSPPRLGAPLIPPRTPPARTAATDPSDSAPLAEPPGAPAPPPPPPPRPPRTFARVSSGAKVCAKTATSAATSTATRSSRARSSPPPAGAASATSAPSDTSPSPVRILPPREPQAPRFYPRRRTRSPHTPRTAGAGCVARPIP